MDNYKQSISITIYLSDPMSTFDSNNCGTQQIDRSGAEGTVGQPFCKHSLSLQLQISYFA